MTSSDTTPYQRPFRSLSSRRRHRRPAFWHEESTGYSKTRDPTSLGVVDQPTPTKLDESALHLQVCGYVCTCTIECTGFCVTTCECKVHSYIARGRKKRVLREHAQDALYDDKCCRVALKTQAVTEAASLGFSLCDVATANSTAPAVAAATTTGTVAPITTTITAITTITAAIDHTTSAAATMIANLNESIDAACTAATTVPTTATTTLSAETPSRVPDDAVVTTFARATTATSDDKAALHQRSLVSVPVPIPVPVPVPVPVPENIDRSFVSPLGRLHPRQRKRKNIFTNAHESVGNRTENDAIPSIARLKTENVYCNTSSVKKESAARADASHYMPLSSVEEKMFSVQPSLVEPPSTQRRLPKTTPTPLFSEYGEGLCRPFAPIKSTTALSAPIHASSATSRAPPSGIHCNKTAGTAADTASLASTTSVLTADEKTFLNLASIDPSGRSLPSEPTARIGFQERAKWNSHRQLQQQEIVSPPPGGFACHFCADQSLPFMAHLNCAHKYCYECYWLLVSIGMDMRRCAYCK